MDLTTIKKTKLFQRKMGGEKRFKPGSSNFRYDFIDTGAEGDWAEINKGRRVVRLGNQSKKGGVERAKDLTRSS